MKKEIWAETAARFRLPDCDCYANRISTSIAEKGIDRFPLDKDASREIVERHPPFDVNRTPEFYRCTGLGAASGSASGVNKQEEK